MLRILHCPLSGPDLTYISLRIIFCIIEYVTNKRTLNLANRGAMRSSRTGPGELSSGLPGAERSGKMHTDEASATSAPSRPVREELWTVRRLSRRKQIHLCLAELPKYQLHHLGVDPPFPGPQPLSRQDVHSYIVGPRDVSCSKIQQLPLGPQEDLACQF